MSDSLTSSASNCPLFPLCSPCVGSISQSMEWNPKAACDGVHLQSAVGRTKEQIRTGNTQQEEKFHPVSCTVLRLRLISPHPTSSLYHHFLHSSAHAGSLPRLQTEGAGTSTLPFPKAHASPVVPLYPSSSPSLAQYTDHLPTCSPFPRIISLFSA